MSRRATTSSRWSSPGTSRRPSASPRATGARWSSRPVSRGSCGPAVRLRRRAVVATIFDFNGVLVDDEHVHLEAFREVLAPRGIAITDDAYATRYLGFDDVGAFRAMLADA